MTEQSKKHCVYTQDKRIIRIGLIKHIKNGHEKNVSTQNKGTMTKAY